MKLLFFVFVFVFVFDVLLLVSLCSPGCPGTHSLGQAGLELRNLPVSASQSAVITGVRHHCPANNEIAKICVVDGKPFVV